MATRTEPMKAPSLDRCWFIACWLPRCRVPFGRDEVVQPADLTLDELQPVSVQLGGVAVRRLAGRGLPEPCQPLLHPGPPAFEDPQPDLAVDAPEEGEPHVEG